MTDWREKSRRQKAELRAITGGSTREPTKVLELRRATVASLRGTLERRSVLTLPFEVRERSNGRLAFTGYPLLWGDRSEIGDVQRGRGFYEVARRGCLKRCLNNPDFDCVLNVGHGDAASGLPIARVSAGTLRLQEDERGLRCDADLDPDDPDVQLVAIKLRNGSLDGQMSYAFRCSEDSFDDETSTRELIQISIAKGDVSIVPYGANPNTMSAIRSRSRAPRPARAEIRAEMVARVRAKSIRQQAEVRGLRKAK